MSGFLLTVLGVCALSLGMKRHFRQVFPGQPFSRGRQYMARAVAAVLLTAAAVVCARDAGVGVGLTVFVAYLNLTGFGLALGLAWRDAALRRA